MSKKHRFTDIPRITLADLNHLVKLAEQHDLTLSYFQDSLDRRNIILAATRLITQLEKANVL